MIASKKISLLLIIYTLFFQGAKSQELHLKITAQDSLKNAVIDSISYQRAHNSFKALSQEVDSVFHILQKEGYVDAEIFPIEKKSDSLYFARIGLGKKYRALKIYYETLPVSKKMLDQIALNVRAEYFSVAFTKIEQVLRLLNHEIANRGRPFSFLQLEKIRKGQGDTLVANLGSTISKPRSVDEIVVKGYEKFPVSYISYFLGIKKGRPFNKKLLEEKVGRLQNLPFAESIRAPEVQFTQDSTKVYLYLEKERSNTFDGFLGFSNDADENKLKLTGHIDFLLLNNLNYGESLNVQYKADGEEQVNFRAELDLPYLFQTPIGLSLGLEIFKKDSTYVTVEQHIRAKYRFGSKITTYLGFRKKESNNLLEEVFAGNMVEDYVSNYIDVGGTYTDYSRFDGLFPVKTKIEIDLGLGNRDRSGNKSSQFIGKINARHVFRLNRRNNIYLHNETAVFSSDNPLTNELFRLGGIHSIRGFAENSIFASLFSATQTEYRYILSSNMYVHSLIDYAYYENRVFGLKENLYGIGLGFGLKSDAGLLSINFANGKADGQNFEFSNTKVHLSLRTKF